jgi:hypothetical protein
MEWASDSLGHPGVSEQPMTTSEEVLRRLAIGDPVCCRALMAPRPGDTSNELDARSVALLRLAGSITAGSAGPIWQQRVRDALDAGLSFDEVVGSLVALAPMVGLDRIVTIAPDLARALGYDIDAALEQLDDPAAVARTRLTQKGSGQ